ncbi:MAG TPA: acyltransferase [Rhodanobacteraceae bacterium]|nr:acyltransferase [Rhodanobacteraceae bacterium]
MDKPAPLATSSGHPHLNRPLSIYLDLLRFTAALVVFLSHATNARYTSYLAGTMGPFAHDGVIVFFVLSGFVIAYVSTCKEHSARDYGLSRAARIYSVALPAILLTMALDLLRTIYVPTFHEYQFHKLWFYIPLWTAFGTDWWFLNENMLSNGPFWSLSYEVWYYVIFGSLFYFRGRKRWIFAVIALAIVGPRQWLLFPIWLSGCALYHVHERHELGRGLARSIFLGSIAIYLLLKFTHTFDAINATVNVWFGNWPVDKLRYSQFFAGDYLIATLVLMNIYSARYCEFAILSRCSRWVTLAASFTFSLYLFHMPLMKFYSTLMHVNPHSRLMYALLLGLTVTSVVLLGTVTEWRKHTLRRWLALGLDQLQRIRLARTPAA